ncbi:dihydrolipoyl dehydrogenase [Clostridium sp. LBM24168]
MSCIEVMPKLGLTMTEGEIETWHKKEGEEVKKGEILFDVTTDKLTNEVEAKGSGVLRKILVKEGESAKCLAPVAIIAEKDEDISNLLGKTGAESEKKNLKKEHKDEKEDGDRSISKRVLVIGGGPGGYIAAIRAAQLGNEVTLVEKEKLGGTCLNVGCIPTKALLHSAELFSEIKNSSEFGIEVSSAIINWNNVQKRKEKITKKLVSGVKGLLSANKVKVVEGTAAFESQNSVSVVKKDGSIDKVDFDDAIISTGSVPFIPPIPGVKLDGVLDSTAALNLKSIPESIAIIGGGVIGIEFATLFSELGSKVTILEMLPFVLPPIDRQISDIISKKLSAKGVSINTGCRVTEIKNNAGSFEVSFTRQNDNLNVQADKVLVAIGRRPNLKGLEAEKIGIRTEKGHVCVDDQMRTNIRNIYAIGDCTGKNMLAHVASEQGVVAAENISGESVTMDYKTVPACVYTKPEIASVGITEEKAKESGVDYKIGIFPISANGKAMISGDTDGIVKIIADKETEEILGVHILAPRATDLITEGALALKLEATVEEIITTVHAHPTIGEAFKEAALAVEKRSLNMVN